MIIQDLQNWILQNWWPVALILIAAYIVRRFGDMAVTALVRRTIKYRAHGDFSADDIKKRQNTLISMCSAVLRVLVWLVAGFSIVDRIFPDINLAPLLASAGVLGVAIGFGAQTLIKDFLSGLFIILENQYRVGDVVEIDGAIGTVEQITIRSTILRDLEGGVHYVPNGQIVHAVNKTMGFAKINLSVAVALDADIDEIASIIDEVGTKLTSEKKWKAKIIDPPHFQNIGNFSDTSLEIRITGKTQPNDRQDVAAELRKRLLAAFKKQKIMMASVPTSTSAGVKS